MREWHAVLIRNTLITGTDFSELLSLKMSL